jgi:hypothetical protein
MHIFWILFGIALIVIGVYFFYNAGKPVESTVAYFSEDSVDEKLKCLAGKEHAKLDLLLSHYTKMIEDNNPGIISACNPDNLFDISHILWMLKEIHEPLINTPYPIVSLTKMHRWLGYCQCVIIMSGYTSVEAERNFTRSILSGS